MRACTMANGAVFFVPDEIERKTNSVSYAELAAQDPAPEKTARRFFFFGKRKGAVAAHSSSGENQDRLAI